MDVDSLILNLDERLCKLEVARVAAVEHLNCIRGGIAEVQLLRDTLAARLEESASLPLVDSKAD